MKNVLMNVLGCVNAHVTVRTQDQFDVSCKNAMDITGKCTKNYLVILQNIDTCDYKLYDCGVLISSGKVSCHNGQYVVTDDVNVSTTTIQEIEVLRRYDEFGIPM